MLRDLFFLTQTAARTHQRAMFQACAVGRFETGAYGFRIPIVLEPENDGRAVAD